MWGGTTHLGVNPPPVYLSRVNVNNTVYKPENISNIGRLACAQLTYGLGRYAAAVLPPDAGSPADTGGGSLNFNLEEVRLPLIVIIIIGSK